MRPALRRLAALSRLVDYKRGVLTGEPEAPAIKAPVMTQDWELDGGVPGTFTDCDSVVMQA